MTINAFIEAGKKATPGPAEVSKAICPEHQTETLAIFAYPSEYNCVEVMETGCKCGDEAMNEADAQFWVAARRAVDDVEKLRDWVRQYARHAKSCHKSDMWQPDECTCGLEQIRELVK